MVRRHRRTATLGRSRPTGCGSMTGLRRPLHGNRGILRYNTALTPKRRHLGTPGSVTGRYKINVSILVLRIMRNHWVGQNVGLVS